MKYLSSSAKLRKPPKHPSSISIFVIYIIFFSANYRTWFRCSANSLQINAINTAKVFCDRLKWKNFREKICGSTVVFSEACYRLRLSNQWLSLSVYDLLLIYIFNHSFDWQLVLICDQWSRKREIWIRRHVSLM